MRGHKVDRIRIGKVGRDHQIAFILAIFVIDQNEHATCLGIRNYVFDR